MAATACCGLAARCKREACEDRTRAGAGAGKLHVFVSKRTLTIAFPKPQAQTEKSLDSGLWIPSVFVFFFLFFSLFVLLLLLLLLLWWGRCPSVEAIARPFSSFLVAYFSYLISIDHLKSTNNEKLQQHAAGQEELGLLDNTHTVRHTNRHTDRLCL